MMTREFHFIINEVWCLVARWEMRSCFIHSIKVSSASYYIKLQWILHYYLESLLKWYIIWWFMTFRRAKLSISSFPSIIIDAEGHMAERRCPTCVSVHSDSVVNTQESLHCNISFPSDRRMRSDEKMNSERSPGGHPSCLKPLIN